VKPHGIYIHIPFCRKKCDYCGFYSVAADTAAAGMSIPDNFVARLTGEFDERLRDRHISADTVYFGGGTPSLLSVDQVRTLMRALYTHVDIDPGAEITIEMNPEDISREKLEGYRAAGVNRVVLGVQTLSDRLNKIVGRSSGVCPESMLDLFFGTEGIGHSIDLIFGIPSQGEEELAHDIDSIVQYRPRHISAYLLSIDKNTPLAKRLEMDQVAENNQSMLYRSAVSRLARYGYHQYEISNFSLPGSQSLHNLKYWQFASYFGFGPGAHTFMDDQREYNDMTVKEYIDSFHARLSRDIRTPGSAAIEFIMTGLRLTSGFSICDMERRLDYVTPESVINRILAAQKEGMLEVSQKEGDIRIRLSQQGTLLADSVIYKIVDSLL
jgi:oxygen-independent coproporphyrinogen III oxidase